MERIFTDKKLNIEIGLDFKAKRGAENNQRKTLEEVQ